MTNHIHLVLETPRANLRRLMHRLQTAYTVHFNRRHRRVGHLVQGRYGAWLVERVSLLRHHPWSSHRSYIRPRGHVTFVDHGPILAMAFCVEDVPSSNARQDTGDTSHRQDLRC